MLCFAGVSASGHLALGLPYLPVTVCRITWKMRYPLLAEHLQLYVTEVLGRIH